MVFAVAATCCFRHAAHDGFFSFNTMKKLSLFAFLHLVSIPKKQNADTEPQSRNQEIEKRQIKME